MLDLGLIDNRHPLCKSNFNRTNINNLMFYTLV